MKNHGLLGIVTIAGGLIALFQCAPMMAWAQSTVRFGFPEDGYGLEIEFAAPEDVAKFKQFRVDQEKLRKQFAEALQDFKKAQEKLLSLPCDTVADILQSVKKAKQAEVKTSKRSYVPPGTTFVFNESAYSRLAVETTTENTIRTVQKFCKIGRRNNLSVQLIGAVSALQNKLESFTSSQVGLSSSSDANEFVDAKSVQAVVQDAVKRVNDLAPSLQ